MFFYAPASRRGGILFLVALSRCPLVLLFVDLSVHTFAEYFRIYTEIHEDDVRTVGGLVSS